MPDPVFHSGNGGSISVNGVNLNITSWQATFNPRLAEVTHSGTLGHSKYKATVRDPSWSVEVPWDSTKIPDVDLSLEEGDELNLTLMIGNSGKFYLITGTTVENVSVTVNNQNDIVRMSITGKGGLLTKPVT